MHVARGRVRVHWPGGWLEGEPDVKLLLETIGGARAVSANRLTRNVLVQFDERVTDARRVAAELERLAPEPSPPAVTARGPRAAARRAAEVVPRPSLGAEPPSFVTVERLARAALASAGLAIVAMRGRQAEPLAADRRASAVAAAATMVDGSPELRAFVRHLTGDEGRMALLGLTSTVAQTMTGSPLGLAVSALIAIRQTIESLERRRAFRAYTARSSAKAPAETGWTATLDHGDRFPLRGRIVRGTGSAIARDGLPRRIGPGSKVGAGARVFGGPFVAELQRTPPSRPVVRPVPDEDASYLKWLDLGAFVAGAATFLLTRSLSRSVGVVVLLSPRPGVLARDAADAGANLRALRSGALPVRDDVTLRRPDTVLVASPRVLSD
ncbi:MAG TPA: hypothetical protein VKD88_04660, partial [Gaiellaceae bacterium]|nr:hypothetical protein [Gaiellaceae bacterium]